MVGVQVHRRVRPPLGVRLSGRPVGDGFRAGAVVGWGGVPAWCCRKGPVIQGWYFPELSGLFQAGLNVPGLLVRRLDSFQPSSIPLLMGWVRISVRRSMS